MKIKNLALVRDEQKLKTDFLAEMYKKELRVLGDMVYFGVWTDVETDGQKLNRERFLDLMKTERWKGSRLRGAAYHGQELGQFIAVPTITRIGPSLLLALDNTFELSLFVHDVTMRYVLRNKLFRLQVYMTTARK